MIIVPSKMARLSRKKSEIRKKRQEKQSAKEQAKELAAIFSLEAQESDDEQPILTPEQLAVIVSAYERLSHIDA